MKKFYFLFCLSFIFCSFLHAQKVAPVAVNDTVHVVAGQSVNVMVLNNDYDADGDSIWITLTTSPPHGQGINMLTYIKYTCNNSYFGLDSMSYRITDGGMQSNWAKIYFVIEDCHCFDSVNVNNINAAANPNGSLFWDKYSKAYFEVPRGSGIDGCFLGSLNISGLDASGNLHIAAQRYEINGSDYQSGPVADVYDSTYFIKWQRMWKVTRQQVNDHINNWFIPGYNAPEVFVNWPAHGDTTKGESYNLAPFFDNNGDGKYNPYDGDYPQMRGDLALYFIYNDDVPIHHEAVGGLPLRAEIHTLMYAFGCNTDSALWNSLFLNYKIFNRSSNRYDSTRIGFFSDFDIGNAEDDFVGTDVQRSTVFGYNADNLDKFVQKEGSYGAHPPALGLVLLKGPRMDDDGSDNPAGIDEGINGYGFGDGITDNECYGMTGSVFSTSSSVFYQGMRDPSNAGGYQQNLMSRWKDSTAIVYGGKGYVADSNACGPVCRFIYPGDSDPLHWGTAYATPSCFENNWTEVAVNNPPTEQRIQLNTGPYTFFSGDMTELDFAYVFGRDYVNLGNLAAIPIMQQRIDSVRKYFIADATPCGLSFSNVQSIAEKPSIRVFPNPVSNILNIEIPAANSNANYIVFNLQGSIVLSNKNVNARSMSISTQSLTPGMYFIRVESGARVYSAKFVKQ